MRLKHAPLSTQHAQERKAGIEDLAEKLAGASRRAERLVKEFEELGAGEGGRGAGGVLCGA